MEKSKLFKDDNIGKHLLFPSFYVAVDMVQKPIDMVRFYTCLKKNNMLGYTQRDFEQMAKRDKIILESFSFLTFRGALQVFNEISKTKKFRDQLLKSLRKSISYYAKIKDINPKDLKSGWINVKTGKPAFSPKENLENHVRCTLQEIHSAVEFLGRDVPEDLLDKVESLGIEVSQK